MGETTDVWVTYKDGKSEFFNAARVMSAVDSYPYWVIWEPELDDGRQEVHFIAREEIKRVKMVGLPDNSQKADVVPLRSLDDLEF